MFPLFGIRNIVNRQSSTVTGAAWSKFAASGKSRSGVEIRNPDASLKLWVRRVQRGASAPSAPTGPQDADFSIAPDAALALSYSESIDLYFCNSSGTTTSSAFVATEVGF